MTESRRYLLYKDYQSGLCNEVISVELAVGLAHLTGRTLVYYGSVGDDRALMPVPNQQYVSPPGRRHIVDQTRSPTILELLEDLPVAAIPYRQFQEEAAAASPSRFDSDVRLVAAVFATNVATDREAALAAFAEGRTVFGDRGEDVLHISETNLGYYSRLFFDPPASLYPVLAGVAARKPYRELAAAVRNALGPFDGVHVRLNDFRKFLPFRGVDYPNEVLKNLAANFTADKLLVISTDETENRGFFEPITKHFRRHVFVDEFIMQEFATAFRALPHSDEVALAMLSNLVLQQADDFLGTPGSTFSGIIQREIARDWAKRDQSSVSRAFKFTYSGSATIDVAFAAGHYLETKRGRYSWNRLDWNMEPETKSWYREWPEAIPAAMPAQREVVKRASAWSSSAYGRWTFPRPVQSANPRGVATARAADRNAIQQILQAIGTELMFGADPEPMIARLMSLGAPEAEAHRIIEAAMVDPLIVNGQAMAHMLRKRDWLLEAQERLQQLSPRAKNVERRRDVGGGEFLELYYARNRPVLLEGAMAGWRALSKWTLPFLREAAGILPHGGGLVAAIDQSAVEITMAEEGFAPLADDLGKLEAYLDRTNPPKGGLVRVAEADAFVSLRSDPRNRMLAQIAGRTRFKMIAAADTAKVYDRQGLVSEIGDLDAADTRSRFPLVANARVYDAVLDPGEILFLPLGWWYQMRALDFSVTAAYFNFRWPNDMDGSLPHAPMVRRGP